MSVALREPSSPARTSRAHDVLRIVRGNALDAFLNPRCIAVIGASELPANVGRVLIENLQSLRGRTYLVGTKSEAVFGQPVYPGLAALPEHADLALITTPLWTVPSVLEECAQAGVSSAVILSSGAGEVGATDEELHTRILATARHGGVRIIGPDSPGVIAPHAGLNATFANMARPGNLGFLSQSGALSSAVLDWSRRENVGFSAFISLGAMLDVGWGDLIYCLGDDPNTKAIVVCMETVGDARSFLSAAREVALTKPIVVLKAGRTTAAVNAHAGSPAENDAVFDAALRRVGVLRVHTMADLFNMAEVLGKQPRLHGPRLTIVTNGSGPGVLAADSLISHGGTLTELSKETLESFDESLPQWSRRNPVDLPGNASPERFARAVEIAAADPNADGLLVILTPQPATDTKLVAEAVLPVVGAQTKPVLASWMGGPRVAEGEAVLNDAGIPTFAYPDTAARMFQYLWRYSDNLRQLYETPALARIPGGGKAARTVAEKIIRRARASRRTILTESESKRILKAYGIPTAPKTSLHGGCELMLGCGIDPQFGPVLRFGTAGRWMDIIKDVSLGLPPLNATLARRLMEQTKIYAALRSADLQSAVSPIGNRQAVTPRGAVRGLQTRDTADSKPAVQGVDLNELAQLLVRFSQLVAEQKWIAEIDISPLLASFERIVVLNARITLHGADTKEDQLPRLAIRPYPAQYARPWKMAGGTRVNIRPIRPEDEPAMVRFHATLGERSVYFRYFSALKLTQRVAHERLTRICFNDYDREIALVAELANRNTGEPDIVAVGRLSRRAAFDQAEFALLVADPCQGKGLGTELLKRLVRIGRAEKLARITARMLPENREMQAVARKAGFTLKHEPGDAEYHAEIVL